jgi:hypothetical protein
MYASLLESSVKTGLIGIGISVIFLAIVAILNGRFRKLSVSLFFTGVTGCAFWSYMIASAIAKNFSHFSRLIVPLFVIVLVMGILSFVAGKSLARSKGENNNISNPA